MIRKYIAAAAVVATLTGCTGIGITNGTFGVKITPNDKGQLQPTISLDLKIEERAPATEKPQKSSKVLEPDAEPLSAQQESQVMIGRGLKASTSLSPSQLQMLDLVAQVADRHGIDKVDFASLVWIESKFDPQAKNPKSSASGLCQFINSTARQYKLTTPFDAEKNLEACAGLWKDNSTLFEKKFGYKPTGSDLYQMHQQGGATAIALARAGDRLAKSVASREAIALNLPGRNPDIVSAREFVNVWKTKFEKSRQLFTSN